MSENTSAVVGRFAPSPSGRMHLGNVFCALLAWLSAKSTGGRIVLRIENLDPARSRPEFARQLMDDLSWLGLFWDEDTNAGPEEPCLQSRCGDFYEEAFQKLQEQSLTYPCFCSRDELHAANAPHTSDGAVVYGGRCKSLKPEEIEKLSLLRRPAVRLCVPCETLSFEDGCRGLYGENLEKDCGDFILQRSDGVFAYQLAVVVDDARMGVTQVVRGADLLSSTPRQLLLYRLLGLSAPEFFHVPLLLAPDGRRLSKREKSLDMGALRAEFSPPQLLGRLAHIAGLIERSEPICAAELLPLFSWDKIPRNDIIVDVQMWKEHK